MRSVSCLGNAIAQSLKGMVNTGAPGRPRWRPGSACDDDRWARRSGLRADRDRKAVRGDAACHCFVITTSDPLQQNCRVDRRVAGAGGEHSGVVERLGFLSKDSAHRRLRQLRRAGVLEGLPSTGPMSPLTYAVHLDGWRQRPSTGAPIRSSCGGHAGSAPRAGAARSRRPSCGSPGRRHAAELATLRPRAGARRPRPAERGTTRPDPPRQSPSHRSDTNA